MALLNFGKFTEVCQAIGSERIKKLVHDNEGATGLCELASPPDSSPISQSDITFFETIFDENTSNHLAIGAAYPTTIQGGTKMSEEKLMEHGMNVSITHVDFILLAHTKWTVIGSKKMAQPYRFSGMGIGHFKQNTWESSPRYLFNYSGLLICSQSNLQCLQSKITHSQSNLDKIQSKIVYLHAKPDFAD